MKLQIRIRRIFQVGPSPVLFVFKISAEDSAWQDLKLFTNRRREIRPRANAFAGVIVDPCREDIGIAFFKSCQICDDNLALHRRAGMRLFATTWYSLRSSCSVIPRPVSSMTIGFAVIGSGSVMEMVGASA